MFTILGVESELCKICLYLLKLADTLFTGNWQHIITVCYCLVLLLNRLHSLVEVIG